MLDAISDFWKPAKKAQAQEKLRINDLEIGSTVGFGFVPQSSLSGRRLQVVSINTYKFGEESLTSFLLSQERDPSVSMIVAESDGEQYLAISRRMSISDRMKMFENKDLEDAMDKTDATQLTCKDAAPDFKGWVVSTYKRELQGLSGRLFKGDFRTEKAPSKDQGQEFKYTLLVSDSNEHAIEIEKYNDGRFEVYTTVYRRMSDIGEVSHPSAKTESVRPDLKLASRQEETKPAVQVTPPSKPDQPSLSFGSPAKPEAKIPDAKSEPIKLQEFSKPAAPVFETKFDTKAPEAKPEVKTELKPAAAQPAPVAASTVKAGPIIENTPSEKKAESNTATSSTARPATPAAAQSDMKPASNLQNDAKTVTNVPATNAKVQTTAPQPLLKQEIKAVTKATNGMDTSLDSEAIECELRVANKIIDEAIRNEMRLSDVVRRIIELPVAYPEAVHIPISLTDEDFSLLAIRYGISSADRSAIKRRIIEDLNDFSGEKKQQQQSKAA